MFSKRYSQTSDFLAITLKNRSARPGTCGSTLAPPVVNISRVEALWLKCSSLSF